MKTNVIYNKDCLEGMRELPDKCIDLIVTDPPYSTPVVTGFGRKKVRNHADLTTQEYAFLALKTEIQRVLKPGGRMFIFCDDKYYPVLFKVFYEWEKLSLVVWDKGRIGMGSPFRKRHELLFYACREQYQPKNRGIPTVLSYLPVGQERLHVAQKPLKLVQFIIESFSEVGDVVLDLFIGSGTTAVACQTLKRQYVGFELNEEYHSMTLKRLQQRTIPSTPKTGDLS